VSIRSGHFGTARDELDEAAAIHAKHGRIYDQARLTHMAASVSRFAGDLEGARQRATRALELAAPDSTIAVSALTEIGENDVACGDLASAAEHYAAAISAAEAAGLTDVAQATLFRRRGTVLASMGRRAEAVRDLAEASERFARGGDAKSAVRVRVEEATAAQQADDPATAARIAKEARQLAERIGDHQALADLDLLASAAAVSGGNYVAALACARGARQEALQAVAPQQYVSASLAIAQLSETSGDRPGAYDALASGWASVRDLLGPTLAQATFEPKLRELQTRWGAQTFATIKADYEARRRAELARAGDPGQRTVS
jgi:tetratricopeptide (TPR) repeat protein